MNENFNVPDLELSYADARAMADETGAWFPEEAYLIHRVEYLEAALKEIAKREGPFSRNQLLHASNTIDAMAKIAEEALAGTWKSS